MYIQCNTTKENENNPELLLLLAHSSIQLVPQQKDIFTRTTITGILD